MIFYRIESLGFQPIPHQTMSTRFENKREKPSLYDEGKDERRDKPLDECMKRKRYHSEIEIPSEDHEKNTPKSSSSISLWFSVSEATSESQFPFPSLRCRRYQFVPFQCSVNGKNFDNIDTDKHERNEQNKDNEVSHFNIQILLHQNKHNLIADSWLKHQISEEFKKNKKKFRKSKLSDRT